MPEEDPLFLTTNTSRLSRSNLADEVPLHPEGRPSLAFDDVYRACFSFVFRNAKRLGVRDGSVDDVVQEVFLVVHRRLGDYDGRAPLKSWVYGILARVVRGQRRTFRRKDRPASSGALDDSSLFAVDTSEPQRLIEQREAARFLFRLLDMLDDDKREVLILAELEQMTVPEIADAIGVNLNTVYSRVKAARKAFIEIHARESARAARGRR
jgi:RNA polymerase sigma-70 factor (ECF subfamily)